jgi:hypothetical protein
LLNESTIIVRFAVEGFHWWPGGTGKRAYLAAKHRHLFHVEAETEVNHDDREIEFHDLLEEARALFPGGDLGTHSCETLARELGRQLAEKHKRPFRVAVFEDNEVGARVLSTLPSA